MALNISATPEAGAEPQEVTVVPGPSVDEKALAAIDRILEPKGDQEPIDDIPKATPDEEPRDEEKSEEAEPEAKAEGDAHEEDSTPAEEGEQEALPTSLSELAEAFEMETDALSEHLKVQIKVDGEIKEVTLGEAMKGYSREADYTQGKMRHAETVKAFEAEAVQSRTQWQQRFDAVEDMAAALAQAIPSGDEDLISKYTFTDSDGDSTFDHPSYLREKEGIERVQGTMQAVFAQLQQQREAQGVERDANLQTYRADQQQKLSARAPEFSDPEKVRAFEAKAGSLLTEVGYSPEEVGGFFSGGFDHRQILLLQKALKQDNLEKSQPKRIKKLKELPKVQRPGVVSDKDPDRDDRVAVAKQRLKRATTRRGRDAAALDIIGNLVGD